MNAAELRAAFPVCEATAYLNAGTDGPLPTVAVQAARDLLEAELADGRAGAHFQRRAELQAALRSGYADLLGCAAEDVALTTSTTEGLGKVLAGMGLGPGDEVLTGDEEHPGLLGPLGALRRRGVEVRVVAFEALPESIGPDTRAIACSHVGWHSGRFAGPELAEVDVPVIYDGAQGAGAVPFDVGALGCAAYAAAGQKWCCGADGTGMLYVSPAFAERCPPDAPGYAALAEPSAGLDSAARPGALGHDTPSLPGEAVALSLAALELLSDFGWAAVHERGVRLAGELVERLGEHGRTVAPRGASTLVSFESEDPEGERDALAAAGVVVRNLPGTPWLRASVGAWNDESDLERLVAGLA